MRMDLIHGTTATNTVRYVSTISHDTIQRIAASVKPTIMELSTLNFAHAYAEADPDLRDAFYKRLISTMSESGFVKIVNHGIGVDLIQEAFGWVSPTDEPTYFP